MRFPFAIFQNKSVMIPGIILATSLSPSGPVKINPTLTWGASLYATSYEIQYSTDNTFITGVTTVTSVARSKTITTTRTTIYYRIRGVNSAGFGSWATGSFSTPPLPGIVTVITSPANNSSSTSVSTYSFTAAPNATFYNFKIYNPSGTLIYDTGRGYTTFTLSAITAANGIGTYSWYITAENSVHELGTDSAWFYFTITA